ncbi:hypothetical protein FO519_004338 [Halicephalobus sp. NKZ332]|nr:hypothetical protein FO519_004338 [Halicephalobus sp. NKZ332]
MDGILGGKSAALGALCRIVCEKSSSEELTSDNLAQFYYIMHKALIERERLSLCSIIYYGTELFKIGLKGVEILLPNYLMAVDIVLTESMKVRLHPSIQEIEMRHTCLQSLASIVSWPTVFSSSLIIDENAFLKLGQGGTNLLEQRPTYLDLRQRLLKCLIHTLRNETDSTNLYLALSTCAIFCFESARHDLENIRKKSLNNEGNLRKKSSVSNEEDEEERFFAVSALRAIVSAICDNISKPQWTSELTTSLAALDCLNSLSNISGCILFYNDEMSTGSLIVASLCRFIDVQLKKPPMHHSKDLHSSVVAAYYSLSVWLTTAPKLSEIESCLITVAEAIEFGLTGGKNLEKNNFKPASLRRANQEGRLSIDSAFGHDGIKQFEFPHGFEKPLCKLDAAFPAADPPAEASKIINQLQSIRNRLQQGGGSASGHRDSQNVWIQSSLGALLTQQLKPQNPSAKVNSMRNFLYDLGFINENAFNTILQPLDSGNSDEFFKDLHQIVDRTHVRTIQTVGIFYVKDGQKNVNEILENSLYLDETSPEFCKFLSEVGDCVQVGTHPHWTGHWATAFSNDRKSNEPVESERYTFDGINHCLWWADNLLEIAFVLYSERSPRLQNMISGIELKEPKFSVVKSSRGTDSVTDSAFEEDSAFGTSQGLHPVPLAAHHPTWHQLRKQGHVAVAYTVSQKDIETNNNMKEYQTLELRGSSPNSENGSQQQSRKSDVSQNSIISGTSSNFTSRSTRTPTINSDSTTTSTTVSTTRMNSSTEKSPKRNIDQRIFVVWLERIEDMYHFPYESLFEVTEDGSRYSSVKPDYVVIYLHLMEPELVRVHVEGIWTKYGQPGPLADGSVVSLGSLPKLLKQTISSISRRKCFEIDNFQSTSARRRAAIQEFSKKYSIQQNYTEFLDSFIFT